MGSFSFEKMDIDGAYIINSFSADDNRGSFVKSYEKNIFHENGIDFDSLLSKMFMQMKNMFETCRSQTAEDPEFFHAATGTNPFL